MKILATLLLLLPATSAFAAPASSPRLEALFNPAVIGTSSARLAEKYGQPIQVDGLERTYRVDGCNVLVRTMERGSINSVAMDVTPDCNVSLTSVMTGAPALYKATYGQLEERLDEGRFAADCIKLCGNAFDPSVYQTWELDGLENPMELRAYTKLVTDDAIDASIAWSKGIERVHGEDFVIDGDFNCDLASDTLARVLFKDIRITRIELGYVAAERCAAG